VPSKPNARIAVDIGGTFTGIALDHGSSHFTAKTLTTQQDPVRGGHDGCCGHLALKSGRLINGKGKQQIPAGEILVFQTPGGAGYGDPRKRSAQLVARDYAAGLISKQAVKRDYAVVLKRDGSVDKQATRRERKP